MAICERIIPSLVAQYGIFKGIIENINKYESRSNLLINDALFI